MKISYLILGYNCSEHTLKCLETLTKFEADCEILFLDNCSLDDTWASVCKNFSHCSNVSLLKAKTNLGVSGGRNYLLKKAKGDVLVFMDNDAYLTGKASTKIKKALSNPAIGIYGQEGVALSDQVESYTISGRSVEVDAVSGYFQCFRRDVLNKVGLIDSKFKTYGFEDLDFSLRVKKLGYLIIADANIPVVHIRNQSSGTLKMKQRKALENNQYFIEKWKESQHLLEINRKSINHLKCVHCGGEWIRSYNFVAPKTKRLNIRHI